MEDPSPRTIFITGATDGIGLALAHHYRRKKEKLILLGRRPRDEVPLTDFPPDVYCRANLARSDCAEIVTHWLAEHKIQQLDILIHNAGVGYVGSVAEQSRQSIRTVMAVNLGAVIALTHALLPFLQTSRGKIVFISSIVSHLPCPNYAVYGASKAAIDGFARSLRIELQDSVAVQVIHPGATRTGMHEKSGLSAADTDWKQFPSAESVADQIAQAIETQRRSATIGWGNWLAQRGGKYLAGLIDSLMRRRYQ